MTQELELAWRGIEYANPWWKTGRVPEARTRSFRRHAFSAVSGALTRAARGRGVVVLGPRRVGKTILLHQIVEGLLADGVEPTRVIMLTLDDVSLRGLDLGALMELVESRLPTAEERYLLLDEIQHSPQWSGWLKRIADLREPYRFLATGSSATALRHGGQDAGLGRWREFVLHPWSFREHVALRGFHTWAFTFWDLYNEAMDAEESASSARAHAFATVGPRPANESRDLERALVDYLAIGGYPEVADGPEIDLREAQRHIRQDILDRALGRDVVDVTNVDTRALERLFLRICRNPGSLWSTTQVASDIGVSQPTVARYMDLVSRAFLAFFLSNRASPIKGQPKAYLVAPSLRSALFNNDRDRVREPEEWGRLVENMVVTAAVSAAPPGTSVEFWRKGRKEVDVVIDHGRTADYVEVKRGGQKAMSGLVAGAEAINLPGWGWILTKADAPEWLEAEAPLKGVVKVSAAEWLYQQRTNEGGRLTTRG